MSHSKPLIVLAAGGTGGHLFPAQALAEELHRKDARVLLVTDNRGARYTKDFPCDEQFEISAASSSIGGPFAAGLAAISIAAGLITALKEFKKRKPAAAIGFGGYPSLPSMKAAAVMKIPYGVHEQNGVLGRANRTLTGGAKFVAHAFPILEKAPKNASAKLIELGNPVRDAVERVAGEPYVPPESDGQINLLIFGGSQGATIFSTIAPHAIAALPGNVRTRLRVTHQARDGEVTDVQNVYRAAGVSAEVAPFFGDLPMRMAKSHLVISRSGASTVTELSAIGRPSVLVPLGIAMDDHQSGNARTLSEPEPTILGVTDTAVANKGGAILLPEKEFKIDRLTQELTIILGSDNNLSQMAQASKGRVKSGAAAALAELTLGLIEQRKVAQ